MKLIVDIPEDSFLACRYWVKEGVAQWAETIIAKGTPLLKGHGRIGDLDAVMNDISAGINAMTNIGIAVDGEYLWAKLNDAIDNAQTIIPAESEEDGAE